MASNFNGNVNAENLLATGSTRFTGAINSSGLYGFHLDQGGWSGIMFSGTNATKSIGMHYGGSSDNKLRLGRYGDNGGAWEANPIMFDIDQGNIETSGDMTAASFKTGSWTIDQDANGDLTFNYG